MKILSFFASIIRFINTYFKTFVFLSIVVLILLSTPSAGPTPNLAKIYLNSMILDSSVIQEQAQKIKESPNIKGVLLVIDSPGGLVGASIDIADIIYDLNQHIPVVTYVNGSMTSGSYYAGMYSRAIIANRGAMIGSIGVILNGFDVQETMDKIGVRSQSIKAGEYKEIGTSMRAWSKKEKDFLQNLINEQYMIFVRDVLDARHDKIVPDPNVFAEGKVFSSYRALELGLIDGVNTMQGASELLCQMSGVKKPIWLKKATLDMYLDKLSDSLSSKLWSSLSARMF